MDGGNKKVKAIATLNKRHYLNRAKWRKRIYATLT